MDINCVLNTLQCKADEFTNNLGIKKVKVCSGKFTGYRYFGRKLMFADNFIEHLSERHLTIILAHEIGHAFYGLSLSSFFNGRCYIDEMKADSMCKHLTGTNLDEWRSVIYYTAKFYPNILLNPVEYTTRKNAFI
ncbi:hypothetical protein H5S42_22445 [Escherichia coli]|uniref:hypothetical protein n=1 Tax=Escherichia coli TaxID=562 RepID=UPI000CFB1C16|nr:hypothetical protein [Escherichia coli]MBZ8699095.1 hypothetical protein [Escherichia coli]